MRECDEWREGVKNIEKSTDAVHGQHHIRSAVSNARLANIRKNKYFQRNIKPVELFIQEYSFHFLMHPTHASHAAPSHFEFETPVSDENVVWVRIPLRPKKKLLSQKSKS